MMTTLLRRGKSVPSLRFLFEIKWARGELHDSE
jgi:hypothetical protein